MVLLFRDYEAFEQKGWGLSVHFQSGLWKTIYIQ